ncbi:unnamed protein product [Porites lobata]|uniref:Uncharacterized protein n=1 Tax=Porites lobata TaxID=104759 RepID=A0ABN8QK33_9CNID|nr:unnamed protein product [Porites lobata]
MEGRSAEDCVVLLEELIQSNRKLAAENEKLRREHEAARRNQTQVLQRIEQRLNEREAPGERHRSRRRAAAHIIAFPVACRRTLRQIYKVLSKKEDFHGFYLDEEVSSDNNATIFLRVMAQVLHQHGGEERCP